MKNVTLEIDTWNYEVMLAPNAVGLAVNIALFILQFVLGLVYRQWWFVVSWGLALLLNIAGFVLRVGAAIGWAAGLQEAWTTQYAFFILSPAVVMAGVYFQMSKLLTIYGLEFARFPPMAYAGLFSSFDLLSIIVQAIGGGLASGTQYETGRWIVLAGIIVQIVSMAFFIVLFSQFVVRVYRSSESERNPAWQHVRERPMFKFLIPAIYVCIVFVYTRSIYRLVELSEGWVGYLDLHEGYFLVLDTLMMALAVATLTIFYPGFAYGSEPIPVVGLHRKNLGRRHSPQPRDLAESNLSASTEQKRSTSSQY